MTNAGSFDAASGVRLIGQHRYAAVVPDGWQQGRGAFGGLVLGTMLRAVEHAEGDSRRRPRTLVGDLCGPVLAGDVEIAVRGLRRGNNQSNWQAELSQGGETLAVASVVLSTSRPVTMPRIGAPAAPAPSALPKDSPVLPMGMGIGPTFAQHYEYRNVGALPFTSQERAGAAGYIRERVVLPRVDHAAITARLDAWWPASFATESAPRPMATISFAAQYLVDPSMLPPDAPLYYAARVDGSADGFFLEARELWHDGMLVALNQQTFVVIK